jgi:hypothetical protein
MPSAVTTSVARMCHDSHRTALPHEKSSFVRFKPLVSSNSELVSPPRPQHRSSALEQERNMAYVKEKEVDFS